MSSAPKAPSGAAVWIVDANISDHLCREKRDFVIFGRTKRKSLRAIVGDGNKMQALAKGTVQLRLPSGTSITIEALYVPKLRNSRLSVRKLMETAPVAFSGGRFFVGTEVVGTLGESGFHFVGTSVKQRHNLAPRFQPAPAPPTTTTTTTTTTAASTPPLSLQLWHQRLGHLGKPAVQALLKMCGSEVSSFPNPTCFTCPQSTQCSGPIPTTRPLELIHSILRGPIAVPSMAGARYFVLYIDDFSRHVWVYFLPSTAPPAVVATFQQFRASAQSQFPSFPIQRFRGDGTSEEFHDVFFRAALRVAGARYEAAAYGLGERVVRTLCTRARAMMVDSKLGDPFWAEALNTAVYLHVRSPARSVGGKTPFEVLNGRVPEITHLRRFGCVVYGPELVPCRGVPVVAPREYVMVGYMEEIVEPWRLWDPVLRDLKRVVSPRFCETRVIGKREDETEVFAACISAKLAPLVGCKDEYGDEEEEEEEDEKEGEEGEGESDPELDTGAMERAELAPFALPDPALC